MLPLPSLVRVGTGGASEPESRFAEGRGADGDRDIPGRGGIGGGGSLDGGGTMRAKKVRPCVLHIQIITHKNLRMLYSL